MRKPKVILVTDGDSAAQKAAEIGASNIGGRCISLSAGNPTLLTGEEIVEQIKKTAHDPVVVMVDDRGAKGKGKGEKAMEVIINHPDVDVLGVVAVSSNGKECKGFNVSCSVTKDGQIVEGAVDKYGNDTHGDEICGDTLSILRGKKDLLIIGLGDPGKMDYNDEIRKGAPITTKALKEVLNRSGKE
ncbi:MAG: stage V sporulation protein AE [Acetivibrionales bacterium]